MKIQQIIVIIWISLRKSIQGVHNIPLFQKMNGTSEQIPVWLPRLFLSGQTAMTGGGLFLYMAY